MSEENLYKSFQFFMPVELVKSEQDSDEAEDSWKIQGIASTEDQDLQGESVSQEGLDISILKAGRGLFNYDHLKGPENIVGQIDDADFIRHNGKKALLVKGYLFKHQPRGQAFHNIMKSIRKGGASRVHLSIEGKILQRDPANPTRIRKAKIDKVALTLDPVNPNTFVDLLKSLAEPEAVETTLNVTSETSSGGFKEDLAPIIARIEAIEKTMCAGAGYAGAPTSMQGGEVLTKESMDKKTKKVTYDKRKKKLSKSEVKLVIDSICKSFPDQDPVELAKMVCAAVIRKQTEE